MASQFVNSVSPVRSVEPGNKLQWEDYCVYPSTFCLWMFPYGCVYLLEVIFTIRFIDSGIFFIDYRIILQYHVYLFIQNSKLWINVIIVYTKGPIYISTYTCLCVSITRWLPVCDFFLILLSADHHAHSYPLVFYNEALRKWCIVFNLFLVWPQTFLQ